MDCLQRRFSAVVLVVLCIQMLINMTFLSNQNARMEDRITAFSQELKTVYDPTLRHIKALGAKIDRLELEQAVADPMMQYIETITEIELSNETSFITKSRIPLVSVIIPFTDSWNYSTIMSAENHIVSHIIHLVESRKVSQSIFEFILVLGASRPDGGIPLEFCNSGVRFTTVRVTHGPPSFSVYANAGRVVALGKYLLFLSPQIRIPFMVPELVLNGETATGATKAMLSFLERPRWLRNFTEEFSNQPLAAIGPKILKVDSGHVYSAGINFDIVSLPDAVPKEKLYIQGPPNIPFPVHQLRGYLPHDDRISTRVVPAVAPDFFFVRAAIFDALDYFNDEIANPILAVTDFCLRAEEKKFYTLFYSDLTVFRTHPTQPENPDKELPYHTRDTHDHDSVIAFEKIWRVPLTELIERRYDTDLTVMWDTFCGCMGFNVEVMTYLSGMYRRTELKSTGSYDCFCPGLPESSQEVGWRMVTKKMDEPIDVMIVHKDPLSYPSFPQKDGMRKRPRVVIGRSMYESDAIPTSWGPRFRLVDEVWVPAQFLVPIFGKYISADKIKVVPESIDIHLWNPDLTAPMKLPRERRALVATPIPELLSENPFVFLSEFKWEVRKGWDVLLQAYFEEFTSRDPVVLYIHTFLFGDKTPREKKKVWRQIEKFVLDKFRQRSDLPEIQVITKEFTEFEMPQLFKAADAFVLPSRGEGWGMPVMEAMAMGLPAIATNCSGLVDFMTESNSLLIPVTEYRQFRGWKHGQLAVPSLAHTRAFMRYLFANPQEGLEIGKRARQHVVNNFSQEAVADTLAQQLKRIHKKLRGK